MKDEVVSHICMGCGHHASGPNLGSYYKAKERTAQRVRFNADNAKGWLKYGHIICKECRDKQEANKLTIAASEVRDADPSSAQTPSEEAMANQERVLGSGAISDAGNFSIGEVEAGGHVQVAEERQGGPNHGDLTDGAENEDKHRVEQM